MTGAPVVWAPQPKQLLALQCPARELLYGGAAGGGKSDYLLADALYDMDHRKYRGVYFRRNTGDLREIIDRSHEIFPVAYPGAVWHVQRSCWRLPAGGEFSFGHLDDLKAALAKRSIQYNCLIFDELTLFDEAQYRALLQRVRSPAGLKVRIRCATNPGGPGHEWVKARWAPWLDKDSKVKAAPGEVLWYLPDGKGGTQWVAEGTPGALSRCFIPSLLEDNKILTAADPDYAVSLLDQDALTVAQIARGDWGARAAPRVFFDREKWLISAGPSLSREARRVRYWDRAATEAAPGKDPDWTVGALLALEGERWCVEDVVRLRAAPGTVFAAIVDTAKRDGAGVEIGLSLDPGQAGVFEGSAYLDRLQGYPVRLHRETGDKLSRIKAAAAQIQPRPGESRSRWSYVDSPGVRALLDELEAYPDSRHDDDWDSLTGAFRVLASGGGCQGGTGLAESTGGITPEQYRALGVPTKERDDDDDYRERRGGAAPLAGGMRHRR